MSAQQSIAELEALFDRELAIDRRAAAEVAYALAWRHRSEYTGSGCPLDNAKAWATRAIELLDSLPSSTMEHVASTRASVGGVSLPELLHANVVRERLADVLRPELET